MANTKMITQEASMMIESLFERREKIVGKAKAGSIRMTGERLNGKKGHEEDYRVYAFTYMLNQQSSHGYILGYGDEFISEFSVALVQACAELGDRFPSFSDYKNDKHVQNKTNKYLKMNISKTLYMLANPEMKQTRNHGKNAFVDLDSAPNIEVLQESADDNNKHFNLSDENSLYIESDAYREFNSLIKHYLKNRTRILTKKQNEFYETMMTAYVPQNNGHITKKDAFKKVGYTTNSFNRYKGEILKRTLADFEQFGENAAMSTDGRVKLHKVFKQFVEVVNTKLNPALAPLNLSVILRENYEDVNFEMVILKGLSTEEKQHVVRVVKGKFFVSSVIAHKIAKNIEEHLEQNPLQKVEPSQVKSEYNEKLFSDKYKDSTASNFKMNAAGVMIPLDFSDEVVEINEVKVYKLEDIKAM